MLEIKCLVCEETVEIPDFIDTDNYDGQVVCQKCRSLLHVKLVESKVRQYKVVERSYRAEKEILEELRRLGKQSVDK